ncbi:hypothetical protein [Rhizobium sp. Root482]|uniref:hypothetical protein n=1 Tax=Rhizobium sp. Root482 TaxID=1736543 RepID=UPI000725CB13|nr:hypothetical protein [Rhizobium sp. Root482]KQY20069.1 hypothetical protein ASD31_06760 [Rhizobium sp. Root482]
MKPVNLRGDYRGSLNLLVFIKISSFIKPEKILLLKPVNLRGDYQIIAELGRIFFVSKLDRNLGGMSIHNYFNRTLPLLAKSFSFYAEEFDKEGRRKMLLLPLRNFIAAELNTLDEIFSAGVPAKGLPLALSNFFGQLRKRQTPMTVSTSPKTYFVDDKDRYFAYGPEHHAKPDTKNPPHGNSCLFGANFRFGKRYEVDKHYNVSLASGKMSGEFPGCHVGGATVSKRDYINMFPNDFIA